MLRAGEVVPDEHLIDDVWGEQPPVSAAHSLEAYVSRLRGALAPHGVALERRAGGYRLDLGRATLDSRVFESLAADATEAAGAGDHERAAVRASEALGLWHGPLLAGTPLYRDGRAEAERLAELRARVLEVRVDADLALGRHSEIVGELRRAAEEDPYRQRLVAQLMVALYRSGRHAEALEVYESTRRRLDVDLGLQPSEELQRLAGQIVRQEPELRAPPPRLEPSEEPRAGSRRRRAAIGIGFGVAAAVVALGSVVVTGAGPRGEGATRVALIRMWNPAGPGGNDEAGWGPFVEGLLAAQRKHGVETEIIDLFPSRPPLGGNQPGSPDDVARLSARLGSGDFDLVLWPLGLTGPSFFTVVREHRGTRFVFLDMCCSRDVPDGSSNSTTITLRADRAAHLAGYLSGLMEARRSLPSGRRHTVSIVLGEPNFRQEDVWRQGFYKGARRALPGVEVLLDYSFEWDDPAACEAIANEQIDLGSGVVFAAAGECGLGALSAAGLRGVWGVGADEDRTALGPHVLASATKRFDRLTELSVDWYLEGRLPPGGDVELGLRDDAVALVGISPEVPLGIRSKVAREAARLRAQERSQSS